MTDDRDFGPEAHRGARPRQPAGPNGVSGNGRQHGGPQRRRGAFALDPWSLAEGVLRRWHWLILTAAVLAAIVFLYTKHIWRNAYTASVQLIRMEALNSTVYYKPRLLDDHRTASLLKSPELLAIVGQKPQPRLSPSEVASRVVISPARESAV